MANIITSVEQLNISLEDIPSMPLPRRVFMIDPTYFSINYVINPHMEGNVGNVDNTVAYDQWKAISDKFRELGLDVDELQGQPGLPDMVFSANQSLPYETEDGKRHVFMSSMHSDQRKEEVPFIEQFYRQKGYEVHYLENEKELTFEGMGDAIWHSGRRLLWGGFGFRTSLDAYKQIAESYEVPVVTIKLTSETFYHLDTCFAQLNAETALLHPDAIADESLELIRKLIPNIIEAPKKEAEELFACNAVCPDGRNVMIQEGCDEVNSKLEEAGFTVHELDTSEFLKSGGSVFCMKMLYW